MSHEITANPMSEIVYTFSFTTDWFHTVNIVAPTNTAVPAPASRSHFPVNHRASTRSVIRNQNPADAALASAAMMLMRAA